MVASKERGNMCQLKEKTAELGANQTAAATVDNGQQSVVTSNHIINARENQAPISPTEKQSLDLFLGHLHRGGAYAYYWRPHVSRWYETNRKRPKAAADRDCYFGVHPSRFIPETNATGVRWPA